ncbi:MAG: 3-isopropylmalate dehydratase small subunit [Gammaproteobacteria bacterium]|nr:MAG: 3-isopropylmalate dehydratase small subunit [Gammaproteobacteria bacterium]
MRAFTKLTGPILVLEQENIDTDQIIPARYLTVTNFDGIGEHAFADWRFDANGDPLPGHVLNEPRAGHSPILVGGHNFGCGSSREHAPHALLGFGFRVVISSQIADIFRSNSHNVGLLPVVLDATQHASLLQMDGEEITVDLEQCRVTVRATDGAEQNWAFTIDPFARHCLLRGLDRFDFLNQAEDAIEAYEKSP